jgi:hypothetical protein
MLLKRCSWEEDDLFLVVNEPFYRRAGRRSAAAVSSPSSPFP